MNNLWLRRSAAANLCSSAIVDDDDDGALAERYRPNCHQQPASTVVFITGTMLTLRLVLIAVINEVSCQLTVLLQFTPVAAM